MLDVPRIVNSASFSFSFVPVAITPNPDRNLIKAPVLLNFVFVPLNVKRLLIASLSLFANASSGEMIPSSRSYTPMAA